MIVLAGVFHMLSCFSIMIFFRCYQYLSTYQVLKNHEQNVVHEEWNYTWLYFELKTKVCTNSSVFCWNKKKDRTLRRIARSSVSDQIMHAAFGFSKKVYLLWNRQPKKIWLSVPYFFCQSMDFSINIPISTFLRKKISWWKKISVDWFERVILRCSCNISY